MEVIQDKMEDTTSKENSYNSNIRKYISIVIWTFRFLGCLPDFRKPTSPLKVILIIYSAILLGGNICLVNHFFAYEPMDNYKMQLQNFTYKSHEQFYLQTITQFNFVYIVMVQIFFWICAKGIYEHTDNWIKFENLCFSLTNRKILPQLKYMFIFYYLLAAVVIITSTVAQFNPYYNIQVRPELALIFFTLLHGTDLLFMIFTKVGSLAAKQLSNLYMDEFNDAKEIVNIPARNLLAEYEALWLKLSELVRQSGDAMSYVMFIQIIRYVAFGLFFSYLFLVRVLILLRSAQLNIIYSWIIEIILTYLILWLIITSANKTELQIFDLTEKLNHEVNENEHNPKFNLEAADQVKSFQETMKLLHPKVKILDYITLDRNFLFFIIEFYLTYLIILVQFKITESSIER